MRFGVQLYGILSHCHKTPKEVFGMIKKAGYCMAEPCVAETVSDKDKEIIWDEKAFKALASLMKEEGLEIPAVHLLSEDLPSAVSLAKRLLAAYGITSFVVKLPKVMTKESLEEAAFVLRSGAEALQNEGASLLLHNEEKDIRTKIDGITAYEWILQRTGTVLKAEVDVGEIFFAGEDPVAFLKKLQPFVKLVHFKDFEVPGERKTETAIGKGALPLQRIVRFCTENGIPQILDMDGLPDEEEALFEWLTWPRNKLQRLVNDRSNTRSYLNIMDTVTGEIKVLRSFDGVIEAPNWLPGKETLVYNANGKLYGFEIETGNIVEYDTNIADNVNNDHVLSWDGTEVALSNTGGPYEGYPYSSLVYRTKLRTREEGAPKAVQITKHSPSYLHGWSVDGKELAYCGFRAIEGKLAVDIYTINADGTGEERRLTNVGFNDGPEYSPDGKEIWFHSDRAGLMQLFKMDCDGTKQTQMTFQDQNNWFPHLSPDGKKVLYIAYAKDALDPSEHLPNMPVSFFVMNRDGSEPKKLVSFLGGQGSLNVNSWAGDSRRFAFVSYCCTD